MKPIHFKPMAIQSFLLKKRIATMGELKKILKTRITMTVFRKLKELSYITSYSHRGKYYTLKNIPDFNEYGLWTYNGIHFSLHNTLLETIKALVNKSERGYSALELLRH